MNSSDNEDSIMNSNEDYDEEEEAETANKSLIKKGGAPSKH
jgi:hypothetical protein